MDLNTLYNQRAELLEARETLLTKAEALTDEEKTRDGQLSSSIEDLNGRISKLEEVQAQRAATFNRPETAVPSNVTSSSTETTEIEGGEPRWVKDPKKGFANIKEFLLTAKSNATVVRDERLQYLDADRAVRAAAGSDENMVSSDAYGGFLVPTGLAAGVLSIRPEDDFLAGLVTSVDMDVPEVSFNAQVDEDHTTSVAGGLTVSRTPETVAGTSSRIKFRQIRMDAKELVGLSYATDRILRYSPSSFVSLLESNFSRAFANVKLDERINGNGTTQMEGILSSGAKIAVAEEATQTNATVIYENVINMRARAWGYGDCIWMCNQDVVPQLQLMTITSSAVAPIWQPSARDDAPDMLLGRPLFVTEFCQTLGTEGDIICFNPSQYLEGTLQPLESAESIHVRFENRESTFRFVEMNDGKSWWTSALTPKYSSAKLSPIVTLATRS